MATIASSARNVTSWIDGSSASGAPGGTLQSVNPADTQEVVAEIQLGDAGTFVDACRAARGAHEAWAHTPAPQRGRAIQQIGRLVEDNKGAAARVAARGIGKPYSEALGEVQEIIDTCNFFLGEGRR